MQTHQLTAHAAYPPARVSGVEARVIGADGEWLRVRWRSEGAQALVVPAFAGRGRADDLWKTTCFELFVRPDDGERYVELNLSPSELLDVHGRQLDRLTPSPLQCWRKWCARSPPALICLKSRR
ncbi:MAG: hypothetical protein ACTHK5_08000, partial [Tsuneonella sp.]